MGESPRKNLGAVPRRGEMDAGQIKTVDNRQSVPWGRDCRTPPDVQRQFGSGPSASSPPPKDFVYLINKYWTER